MESETEKVFFALKFKSTIRDGGLECVCQMMIHAFVCKDTETRGRGEVRHDDSEREQSTGEGPGNKLRAKGVQRRRREDSEGQRRNGTEKKSRLLLINGHR